MSKKRGKKLIVVDFQKDFMKQNGKLYVNGSEAIIGNIEDVVDHARKKGHQVVFTQDSHLETDSELKENGGPFDPHCMRGEDGSRILVETNDSIVFDDTAKYENKELDSKLSDVKNGSAAVLLKRTYDVGANAEEGGNPYTKAVFNAMGPGDKFLVGVALDYCVLAAAKRAKQYIDEQYNNASFLRRLRRKDNVYVLLDCTRPVTPEGGEQAIAELEKAGVKFATMDEYLNGRIKTRFSNYVKNLKTKFIAN